MTIPTSVTQIIEGSGNNFHSRVARWFNERGGHVVVSPYYLDQVQSKARELDLIVERVWPIRGLFNQLEGHVLVRLFVECKFIAPESVLWFAPKNKGAAKDLVCRMSPFRADNTYTDRHHYLTRCERVAKLFATGGGRTQENDPFYKALNQALSAAVAMKGNAPNHPDLARRSTHGSLVLLEYPVIVCSSFAQLYAADFLGDAAPSEMRENFQLEVRYAFMDRHGRQQDQFFLIDVVEFDQLASYETAIVEGVEAAALLAASS